MSYNLAQNNSEFYFFFLPEQDDGALFSEQSPATSQAFTQPTGETTLLSLHQQASVDLIHQGKNSLHNKAGQGCVFITFIRRNHRLNGLSLPLFFPLQSSIGRFTRCVSAAQSCFQCTKQELATRKDFRTVLLQWLCGSFTSWGFGPAASVSPREWRTEMNFYTQSAKHEHHSQSRLFKVLVFNFSTTCETVNDIQIVLGAREGKVDFVLPSFCFIGNRQNARRIPGHI